VSDNGGRTGARDRRAEGSRGDEQHGIGGGRTVQQIENNVGMPMTPFVLEYLFAQQKKTEG